MSAPKILIVDDQDQGTFARDLTLGGTDATHVRPSELTATMLHDASLVIIDEFLEDWPERDAMRDSAALYVRDGVALSALLRAELEERGPGVGQSTPSRTAIVLRTGHLGELAGGLPRHIWSVAVAGRYDLEWVSQKGNDERTEWFAAIAHAAASLPSEWNPLENAPQRAWLGLGDHPWSDRALAQVEQCRPPWSTLSATSSGRVWLAWFLQRIVPFPTFLLDDKRAAAQLGLTAHGLEQALDGPLSSGLEATRYTGQLSDFDGRRWWRAGIAALREALLEETGTRGLISVAAALSARHGSPLEELAMKAPVFTIDSTYKTAARPIEAVDAVRLQPDEWPVYADDPWLAVEDVDDDDLSRLIVIDDRDVVSEDAE
ncbi:hypothetical protein [Clavibacter californiensis]|uniref:Uncharacterized protein n=1 Tax=Clavibacter californiensis TaxID=1401995 RepID=A0ABX9N9L2_9MICO|nr:hypothetical protein [Clavibacter californiensis]RII94876.1 hypothetical protein DZF98_00185 [Clavibacter californiensis]UKF81704.1 hypothetical protein FGD68_15185 [Clavibacter californiensis]